MSTLIEDVQNKDMVPVDITIPGTSAQTAGNFGHFFIVKRPYEVMEVAEVHAVAGTSGSAVTLQLERLRGTQAKGSGTNILATAFDLRGTANTVVDKTGTLLQNRILQPGDRLCLNQSGTLTALEQVAVSIILKPLGKGSYF